MDFQIRADGKMAWENLVLVRQKRSGLDRGCFEHTPNVGAF
jgi:hypothetical protein